ncbi:glycosyltransferase family 87 protein [Mucilaginibacter sp.]|uniref:glycosyltransferase family 87 protein n=1 Tax=Mucilaginibacter sp. TaxID=1882438 RepID=UPI003265EE65
MTNIGQPNLFYKLLANKYIILSAWVLIAVFYTFKNLGYGSINNYLIFKYTYFNASMGQNLYANYPQYYFDSNHYGPIFCVIIAPFAVLKGQLGIYLWQVCNAIFLFIAIRQLPLSNLQKNIICIICTQELIFSLKEYQTNGAIAGLLILTWVLVDKKKDFWAALFIMLGLFIKLYGVIGIVFFLLSKQKKQFILGLAVWAAVFFVLPMLFFSPQFIACSYLDWYHSLVSKNAENLVMTNNNQDISVMGMLRRITALPISILPVLLTGLALFGVSNLKNYMAEGMRPRLLMLASCLLFVVLFSTGSEQCTYIIAFTGIAIWFISAPKPFSKVQITLFVFALYFGSLFRTDIFPAYIKTNLILPYGLKALPCLMVWLAVIKEMLAKKPSPQLILITTTPDLIAPTHQTI